MPPPASPANTNWTQARHWTGRLAHLLPNTVAEVLHSLVKCANQNLRGESAFGSICVTQSSLDFGDRIRESHRKDSQTRQNAMIVFLAAGILRYGKQQYSLDRGPSAPVVYEFGDAYIGGSKLEQAHIKTVIVAARHFVSRKRGIDPADRPWAEFESKRQLVETMRGVPAGLYGGVLARERLIASLVDVAETAKKTPPVEKRKRSKDAPPAVGWAPGTDVNFSYQWTAEERYEVVQALRHGDEIPQWARLSDAPQVVLASPDGHVDMTLEQYRPGQLEQADEPAAEAQAPVVEARDTPADPSTYEEWMASTAELRLQRLQEAATDTAVDADDDANDDAGDDGALPGLGQIEPPRRNKTKPAARTARRRAGYDPTDTEQQVIDGAVAKLQDKYPEAHVNWGHGRRNMLTAMRQDTGARPWTADTVSAAWADAWSWQQTTGVPSPAALIRGVDKASGRSVSRSARDDVRRREDALAASAGDRSARVDPAMEKRRQEVAERNARELQELLQQRARDAAGGASPPQHLRRTASG